MNITVSGKKINVGGSLSSYIESRLNHSVTKFFDQAVSANVTLSKNAKFFHAEIIVNEGTGRGMRIKAEAESEDGYMAFDHALIKIEKQLRRYKSRIKNHHKSKLSEIQTDSRFFDATKYVISTATERNDDDEQDETGENPPIIIAERKTKIHSMTVSEAVMEMDLASLPALMFINKKSDKINLVYKRADGNISWVDTPES